MCDGQFVSQISTIVPKEFGQCFMPSAFDDLMLNAL